LVSQRRTSRRAENAAGKEITTKEQHIQPRSAPKTSEEKDSKLQGRFKSLDVKKGRRKSKNSSEDKIRRGGREEIARTERGDEGGRRGDVRNCDGQEGWCSLIALVKTSKREKERDAVFIKFKAIGGVLVKEEGRRTD